MKKDLKTIVINNKDTEAICLRLPKDIIEKANEVAPTLGFKNKQAYFIFLIYHGLIPYFTETMEVED